MKIMFLQELTGGLLNGLLKSRFKGLFTRTPVLAVLLLTAVVAACASDDSKSGGPPPPKADCVLAEDVGNATDCGLLALPQTFDYPTTYNITVGEVLAGRDVNTDKLGVSNFTFTQIINGNLLDPMPVPSPASNNNQLTLRANATAISLNITVDNNVFGEFYIELVLVDNDEASVKVRYTISITAVNDDPVFSLPSYSFADIPFNSTTGYSVGNVSVTDIDSNNNTITYSISGGEDDKSLFRINSATDSATGEITLKAQATNAGEYTFNVTARDGKDGITMAEITVRVLTDNQAPAFEEVSGSVQFANATGTTPANYTFAAIPFNSAADSPVGNVSAMDPDDDIVSYNISGGDDDTALFRINSATGEITLKVTVDTAVNSGNYAFNVTASDGKGGSAIATISVEVIPNQAPVFEEVIGSESQFAEAAGATPASYTFAGIRFNSAADSPVGNVLAIDRDAADSDTVTYNISGEYNINGSTTASHNDLFQINSSGGITLGRGATANDLGRYTFNVTASDDQDASTTARISVTVIDGTPPVFVGAPYEFDLPLAAGVVVGKVSATDTERTPFDYSLSGSGDLFDDLFEPAAADNADGTRNIILSRAVTIDDLAEFPVTFQIVATHQIGELSSEADITVTSDTDGDRVINLYDAFPDDGANIVNGDGNFSHPYIISNIYQLQAIAGVDHTGTALDSSTFTNNSFLYGADAADQLTKHYILANNINAADTAAWAKPAVGSNNFIGHGWTPIAGGENQVFNGSFTGDGYHIHNLNMNLQVANNKDTFGLFGTNGGNISAVGLTNINMQIAAINGSFINDTSLAGNGETESYTLGSGALAGTNNKGGSIKYAYSTGIVNVEGLYTGGLVGVNIGNTTYSYSTATVTGRRYTGGLVGVFGVPIATSAEISSSYATGNVTGTANLAEVRAGGLVGGMAKRNSTLPAKIYASYAGNAFQSISGSRLGGPLVGTLTRKNTDTVYQLDVFYSYWTNSTVNTVERDEIFFHSRYGAQHAYTFTPSLPSDSVEVPSDRTRLKFEEEFENCALDECSRRGHDIFPSPHWNQTLDDPGIERGWIFEDGKYPALYANRTLNSVTTSLMPSLEAQDCHRIQVADACGTYDAVE